MVEELKNHNQLSSMPVQMLNRNATISMQDVQSSNRLGNFSSNHLEGKPNDLDLTDEEIISIEDTYRETSLALLGSQGRGLIESNRNFNDSNSYLVNGCENDSSE